LSCDSTTKKLVSTSAAIGEPTRSPNATRYGQQLENIEHDPAGTTREQSGPPGDPIGLRARRQEAQVIHLLGRLRDQREQDRGAGSERQPIEPAAASRRIAAAVMRPAAQPVGMRHHRRAQRGEIQYQPDRLRPKLKAPDQRDAVRHQRHHGHRAKNVAEP
jgi:hypothetical protein